MSTTANEYDEPGGNYPDRNDAADIEADEDALRPKPAPGSVQDEPALAQNVATDDERVAGIVAQVRADVGGDDLDRITAMLRQRLGDAGIEASERELADLTQEVRSEDPGDFARKGRG